MENGESRIEELVAEFLDSILAGQSPGELREALIAENQDLQPELGRRLTFAESVFRIARGGQDSQGDAGEGEQQPGTVTSPFWRQKTRLVKCPHCGTRLNIVSDRQSEVTCASCGSIVTINDDVTATVPLAEVPERIGRFVVHSFLGGGGFGVAYRATDPRLGRTVAIKVPRAGQFVHRSEKERFLREARNAARLRHPNIVQVFEINSEEESPYIVSEFIEGVTLSDRISAQRIDPREAAQLMATVAEAVHHAHEHEIIHRDLKPSNILLDLNNKPYVADFGLAINLDADFTMTLDGEILGTPAYMSPEQANGLHSRISAKSDVYSLGVILYRLLCCENPFRGSARMMLHQVIHDDPISPRRVDDRVPVELETIILTAMSKSPEKRYASAREFAQDLERWLADLPILARPEGKLSKAKRWMRRNPRLTVAFSVIAGLLVLISLLSSIWAMREDFLAGVADKNAQAAEENAAESNRRLNATLVQNGLRQWESGSLADAAVWFAKALETEASSKELNRTRIGMTFAHHPRLVRLRSLGSSVRELELDVAGNHLWARTSVNGVYRIPVDGPWTNPVNIRSLSMFAGAVADSQGHRMISRMTRQSVAELRDLSSNRVIQELEHDAVITSVDVSADGSLAASADESGMIKIWNAEDGKLQFQFEHQAGRIRLEFLNGSDRLLAYVECTSEQEQSKVAIWSLGETMAESVFEFQDNIDFVKYVAPTGKLLAAGCDGSVAVWDVRANEIEWGPLRHPHPLQDVYYLANPDELIAVELDGTITTWTNERGHSHIVRHPVGITASSVDSQQRFLAIAGVNGAVAIYWRHSLEQLGPLLPVDDTVTSVVFHPDGRRVIAGGDSGIVRMWDLAGLAPDVPILQHSDDVRVAKFSPDGKRVVSCSDDHSAGLWHARTGQRIGEKLTHDDVVSDVDFSPDGQTIATGSLDKTIRLWNGNSGVPLGEPIQCTAPVVRVQFSPSNGQRLVAVCSDGTVVGWELESMTSVFVTDATLKNVSDFAYSNDGNRLVVASVDGTVVIRDAHDGAVLSPPLTHQDMVTRCGFTHDDEFIWTCGRDNSISLWQNRSPYDRVRALHFANWPTSLASSPQSSAYLTTSYAGRLICWQGDEVLWEFNHRKFYFTHCQIDATGRLAVVCGGSRLNDNGRRTSGSVFLVDMESGLLAAPPGEHLGTVERSFFDSEGKRYVSASIDNTARIWEIETEKRPIADIQRLATVLSGKSLNNRYQLVQHEPAKLEELFVAASTEMPSDFECSDSQVKRWEGYVSWMMQHLPNNDDY